MQGGILDQCAENISRDLYNYFCVDSPKNVQAIQTSVQGGILDQCAENIWRDLYNYICVDLPKNFNQLFDINFSMSREPKPVAYKESVFKAAFANFIVYFPQIANSIYTLPLGSVPIDFGFGKITFTILRDISAGPNGISYSLSAYLNLGFIEVGTDFICLSIHNIYDSLIRVQSFPTDVFNNPELYLSHTIRLAFTPFKVILGYFFTDWIARFILNLIFGIG